MDESISVEEFNQKRAANPEVQKRIDAIYEARLKRLSYLDELSQPILSDLRDIGVDVPRITALYNSTPLPPQVVEVLLRWIDKDLDDELIREMLHLLAKAKKRFEGCALIRLFEKSEQLRVPTADAISATLPFGVADWVVSAIKDSKYGEGRIFLAGAVAKLATPNEATQVLCSQFQEDPAVISEALGKCGGTKEIDFLEQQVLSAKGEDKKAIQKAIKQLQKRVSKA